MPPSPPPPLLLFYGRPVPGWPSDCLTGSPVRRPRQEGRERFFYVPLIPIQFLPPLPHLASCCFTGGPFRGGPLTVLQGHLSGRSEIPSKKGPFGLDPAKKGLPGCCGPALLPCPHAPWQRPPASSPKVVLLCSAFEQP